MHAVPDEPILVLYSFGLDDVGFHHNCRQLNAFSAFPVKVIILCIGMHNVNNYKHSIQ